MLDWLYHLFGQHSPRELNARYGACILSRDHFKMQLEDAQKEITDLEEQTHRLSKDNLMLIDRMHGIEAERDGLRAQLANGHAAPRKRASRAKPPATQEERKS